MLVALRGWRVKENYFQLFSLLTRTNFPFFQYTLEELTEVYNNFKLHAVSESSYSRIWDLYFAAQNKHVELVIVDELT